MADFTGRLEYALLAAVDLAARYDPKAFVKVGAIARRTGAPEKYLGQILLRLKARALVSSASGPACSTTATLHFNPGPVGLGVSARWLDCGLDEAHGIWSTWYGRARATANAPDIEE